ncbi:MAG TPA: zf-HC2 domain-containing protein [Anaeromyxobacteraceae bacterium]|nr:zf-HC2 domain-containing protein [Anaeromyxobacteraceae bacterium]
MGALRPCPEFESLLLDRAGGAIDAAAAARLDAHLAGCEACRAEAAALGKALAAAQLPPPSEAEQRALDRAQAATLRHWRGGEGSRRNRSLLQGFSAGFAVAAAAAVLVIAPGAYRRAQEAQGGAGTVAGDAPGAVAAPGEAASPAVAGSATNGWEPDLDSAWETAALALGEDAADDELASADAADLYDLDD